jgi:hypothetical protein
MINKSNISHSKCLQLLLMVVWVCYFLFTEMLYAQSIPINLKIAQEEAKIEAEKLDFKALEAKFLISDYEEAGTAGACIGISSRENIPVHVGFRHEDISKPLPASLQRLRPRVEIEARWINDGGQCPANTDAGKQISTPFSDGSAVFKLYNRPFLIDGLEGNPKRLTAFVYLVGTFFPGATPSGVLDTLPQPYEGRVTISIEYL